MTQGANYQEYQSAAMKRTALLESGMRSCLALEDKPEPTASALMLGQLQVLAAMLAAGDKGEKTFARKRLLKFIADGRRVDMAKAKSVPKEQGVLV